MALAPIAGAPSLNVNSLILKTYCCINIETNIHLPSMLLQQFQPPNSWMNIAKAATPYLAFSPFPMIGWNAPTVTDWSE